MLNSRHLVTAFALFLVTLAPCSSAHASHWELIWADEFDGSALDLSKWEPQIGTGCPNLCGWGNNELQYYRAENATVAGGLLTIEAKQQNYGGRSYTSARLRTKNLGDWQYGRFEMRAKLPIGQGMWPAFWMLPTDSAYGGWAASGEIDIMEYRGDQPTRVFGTIHHGGEYPDNTYSGQNTTLTSGTFNSDFHVFALEWEATELRWYVDDRLYATQTTWSSSGNPFPAPFDEQFHLLLNLAVGGYFSGDPDGSTVFPQQLVVDYVRVYRETRSCELVYDGMEHASPYANGWFHFNGSVGAGGIVGNTVDLPPLPGEVASLESGWGSSGNPGFMGGFGRSRNLDLSGYTHFEFWINPDAGQSYRLEINLQDDDNGDGRIIPADDDEFQKVIQVGGVGSDVLSGGGWQKLSIPLGDFPDDNSYAYGGNGILDAVGVSDGGNGMLLNIVVTVLNDGGADVAFRTDGWAFTRRTSSIAGRLWEDLDGNGVRDPGEPGLAGVTVELFDTTLGAVVASSSTDAQGDYSFDELIAESFEVRVDLTTLPTGLDATYDPDGTATLASFLLDLGCDETSSGGDFGFRATATDSPTPKLQADRLFAPSPNPFNPRTMLRFELARSGPVELAIYDAQGRLVTILENGDRPAGSYRADWDGKDASGRSVASGVYFASLRTARERAVQRMVLLK